MDNLNTTVEIVGVQNQIDISTSKLFLPTNSNLAFPKLSQKCPHRYKKRKRKKNSTDQTHDASFRVEFIQNVKQFELENFVQELQYKV